MMNTNIYSYIYLVLHLKYLVSTENDIFSCVVLLNVTWFHPYTRNQLKSRDGQLCSYFSYCILHLVWLLACAK